MERETYKINTPIDKIEVELKSWITGKEKRELRKIFLEGVNTKGERNENDNLEKSLEKGEDKAIEIIVVSVNGKKENVVEEVLGMKNNDFSFIKKEIGKITQETDFLV